MSSSQHAPIFQFTGLLGFGHHISGRENTPLMAQGLQTIAGVVNQTKQLFLFLLGYSNSSHNFIKYTYKSSIHTK